MASGRAHVAFLSSALTLTLLLLLVSARVYKAPTSDLRHPIRLHLRRSANPKQGLTANNHLQGVAIGAGAGVIDEKMDMGATTGEQVKSWPHLVGLDAEEAKKKIQEEHPHLQVQIVPAGSFMTMDYNLKRVRVFKDENQKVTRAPKLG